MRARRKASALTALALSSSVVSGAALVASGRVGASAPEVICGQEEPDEDRLRVNLSLVEELFAGLRPPDGGASGGLSPGCEDEDRTGLDVEPPARLSFRVKNFDAEPLADVDTKQMRDDVKGLLDGVDRGVDQVKDPLLQQTDGALEGPGRQLAEGSAPLVDGVNGALDAPAQQLAEGSAPLVDGTSQVVDGAGRLAEDAGRAVEDAGGLLDAEPWGEPGP